MEPSTTDLLFSMYPFKVGDWVEIVDDNPDHLHTVGMIGEIVEIVETIRVKLDCAFLEPNDCNNLTTNIRKFLPRELIISKNAIVRNILNDL